MVRRQIVSISSSLLWIWFRRVRPTNPIERDVQLELHSLARYIAIALAMWLWVLKMIARKRAG